MKGIGIGIYPKGIKKIFNYYIYSYNPDYLLKSISLFFEENYEKKKEIEFIDELTEKNNMFEVNITNFLEESINNLTFKELKDELNNIKKSIHSFDFYFKETKIKDENNFMQPCSLYERGILKGQKILIVMLWTCNTSENESQYVREECISKEWKNSKLCIKKAADYYGVELKIVLNYENAIKKL